MEALRVPDRDTLTGDDGSEKERVTAVASAACHGVQYGSCMLHTSAHAGWPIRAISLALPAFKSPLRWTAPACVRLLSSARCGGLGRQPGTFGKAGRLSRGKSEAKNSNLLIYHSESAGSYQILLHSPPIVDQQAFQDVQQLV